MMSRFSSFSLAVVLSLASAAPVLAAETNRPTPGEQLNSADLRAYARRESGFDNRVSFQGFLTNNPGAYSFSHPYNDYLNGGRSTPAAQLLSDPKALLAESRRGSGLDDNRSASIGSNRSAFAALSTNLKQPRLAARKNYVVLGQVRKPRHTVDM